MEKSQRYIGKNEPQGVGEHVEARKMPTGDKMLSHLDKYRI